MKKTYNAPEFISIDLQTSDIMSSSVIEGFSLFGDGNGDEQGFNFPFALN
jgi:hypothetical protein